MNRNSALITGASSGIGYELARIFAREGYELILVARNERALLDLAEDLQKKHGTKSTIVARDLSVPSSPSEIFRDLQKQSIRVDILVNNAGFATFGFFANTDLAAELQELQLNMVTLTHLTKLFLPAMLERKYGKIMNVASTAGFQPGPLMAVYYATKAYVIHFSEALANELQDTGVGVTALCPGPTLTGFQERAYMEESKLSRDRMDAKTVAEIGYRGLMDGKIIVIPGFKNKFLRQTVRFSPRSLVVKIVRGMNSPKK